MPTFVAAQQITPLASNGAGGISKVASAQVAQDQFVTAVINSTGNLEVIAWYANLGTNQLSRQGTGYAGPVSAVAITSPFNLKTGLAGPFVTASINGSGNLDLIYWRLQSNGAISYVSEYVADRAAAVSVASVYSQNGQQQFMTATQNGAGNLEVSLWYIDTNNQIQAEGTNTAGGISEVSIACMRDQLSDVVTAVRNSAGNLELIQWYYNRPVGVSRGNTAYTSAASHVSAAAVPLINFSPSLYTADIDSAGQVFVTSWDLNGAFLSSTSDTSVYTSQIALTTASTAAFTVELVGTSNQYVLEAWDTIYGWGEVAFAYGSFGTQLSITPVDTSSYNSTVLAVSFRNTSGNLQIQLWKYVPYCSPNCIY
jgi:hypothetical protein